MKEIGNFIQRKTFVPFSEGRQLFEITVLNPGFWLSVGISSESFHCDSGNYEQKEKANK